MPHCGARLCRGDRRQDTGRYSKGFHTKTIRCMCVLKHSAAHAILAHDRANPGKSYIQSPRFGKLRREEAKLNLACVARFCLKCQGKDGSLRRMRFEIEMQQLNP